MEVEGIRDGIIKEHKKLHACMHIHVHLEWTSSACKDPAVDRGANITCRGHKPDRTLNRDDLPLPLGPITSTERPGGTSNVSSRTSAVPSGAFSATLCSSHTQT